MDLNGNSEWDIFDNNDLDGNGLLPVKMADEFDERDFSLNYGGLSNVYKDANDDGVDDYLSSMYEIIDTIYIDWEPNSDFSLTCPMVCLGKKT